MATIAPPEPSTSPAKAEWTPSLRSLYRLSIEQYEAMVASGVFTKRDRFHLINGYMVAKMTEDPPHAAICDGLRMVLESLLPAGWYVRDDRPLKIPNYASIPEPDAVVTRGTWRDYTKRHPEPPDVALVVEVSSSTLREDRSLIVVYGTGGIPVYWIVNLVHEQVEVYSDPEPGGYRSRRIYKRGRRVPVVIAGEEVGRILMADILP
jgi:Uma2 family endonuclease